MEARHRASTFVPQMNNFRTRSTRRSRRNIIAGLVAAQAVTGWA